MRERDVSIRKEYILRLERGEDVLPALADFCDRNNVQSGSFFAIGAVERAKIGYYDLSTKKYESRDYPEAMEVASMTGNIVRIDGAPFIHAHAVLSDMRSNACIGGHVFEAKVAVTLEVHLSAFNEPLSRAHDAAVGLKFLDI